LGSLKTTQGERSELQKLFAFHGFLSAKPWMFWGFGLFRKLTNNYKRIKIYEQNIKGLNMTQTIHPYANDFDLLKSLGLPIWEAKHGIEKFIGEVFPFPHEDDVSKIRVYVTCIPAQFYRFEVDRHSDDAGYGGMETVEIKTGSGTLTHYWPFAFDVCSNMISVSEPVREVF
jgi:hypothetical protein